MAVRIELFEHLSVCKLDAEQSALNCLLFCDPSRTVAFARHVFGFARWVLMEECGLVSLLHQLTDISTRQLSALRH